MQYERMKYLHDQREWVRAADEKVPQFLERASQKQQEAAKLFAEFQELPEVYQKIQGLQAIHNEVYREARYNLFQAIHFAGMKRANEST